MHAARAGSVSKAGVVAVVLGGAVLSGGAVSGCHRHARGGSTTGSEESGGGGRTWSFTNYTAGPICQVWLRGNRMDSQAFHDAPIQVGETVSLALDVDTVDYVFATDCSEPRQLLTGFVDSVSNPGRHPLTISNSSIALVDPSTATPDLSSSYVLQVAPSTPEQLVEDTLSMRWGGQVPSIAPDAALAADGLERARAMVRQNGWSETHLFAFLATDGWVNQEQLQVGWFGTSIGVGARAFEVFVGARWPDGACGLQNYGFTQEGDGVTWTGPIRPAVGAFAPIPCSILEQIPASRPGVAQ